MDSYHCHVQLLLNIHVYILVVLTRVVDREGLGEQQSGMCTHLKVRNLKQKKKQTA